MRTYGNGVRQSRTLGQIFQDTLAILLQDAGEFAFLAVVGACIVGITTFILRLQGGALSSAAVPPVVALAGAMIFAASCEAHRRVINNLQPDAAVALLGALPRAGATVSIALASSGAIAVLVFLVAALGGGLGGLAHQAIALTAAAGIAVWLLPRSLAPAIAIIDGATTPRALVASRLAVAAGGRKAACAWLIVLAPALLALVIALDAEFGVLSTTVAALLFTLSMPPAAIVSSLLYFDAASSFAATQIQQPPRSREQSAPTRPSLTAAQRQHVLAAQSAPRRARK